MLCFYLVNADLFKSLMVFFAKSLESCVQDLELLYFIY